MFSRKIDLLDIAYDHTLVISLGKDSWVKLYFQFFSNGAICDLKENWVRKIKTVVDYDSFDIEGHRNLLSMEYKEDLDRLVQHSASNQIEMNRRMVTIRLSLE